MLSYAELTFGPYVDAGGQPACVGLTGVVYPSARIRETTAGGDVVVKAVAVTIGLDGTGSVFLPHTDQDGIDPVGFTYTVRWPAGFGATPGDATFALPVAAGDVVDYDLISPSEVDPGIRVPVLQGPPGVRGPAGPAGPPGSGSAVTFVQSTPSAVWLIPTTFGRPPSVTLWIDGRLEFTDVECPAPYTTTRLTFPTPLAGTAVLN